MPLMDKLKRLFTRREIPTEARDILKKAETPRELLHGLDQLITRNELEVNNINGEIEALESIEAQEMEKVRTAKLPDRSKNNVLRRIQRLRKQMDNLEERQRIYNRNINLQIHLVGKIQALDAMELRGVNEDRIDDILTDYEDELSRYESVLDTEDIATGELGSMLDDQKELSQLESQILNQELETKDKAGEKPEDVATRRRREPPAVTPRESISAPESTVPPAEKPPPGESAEKSASGKESES